MLTASGVWSNGIEGVMIFRIDAERERGSMRAILAAGIVALIASAAPANSQEAKLLETFNDWAAHANSGNGKKVCFVVSQPKDSEPKNVKRGPIFFYISMYPSENVPNEVSVKMGYPLRPEVNAEVKIGEAAFNLYTKDEGAFVEEREVENKLVQAMKAGAEMVVQGRSTRGTLTTDKYSLNGLTAALERASGECS